jgi:hypothetical protein
MTLHKMKYLTKAIIRTGDQWLCVCDALLLYAEGGSENG